MSNRIGRPALGPEHTRRVHREGSIAHQLRIKRAYFAKVLASIRFTEKAGR